MASSSAAGTFLLLTIIAAAAGAWSTPSLTAAAAAAPSPPPFLPPTPPCVPPQPAVAFLRARCAAAATQHAVACVDSLLPYACVFNTSETKLARASADVNAAWLRSFSKRVKDLAARGPGAPGGGPPAAAAAALRDCASTVSSAAGLANQTAAELGKLDAAPLSGGSIGRNQLVRWAVSNAQTWLSASMTNEATCADGLKASGAAGASMAGREVAIAVGRAKELTSIALALVRGIPLPP